MKRFTFNTLCILALGTCLSAFSCLPDSIVIFDKNNNDPGSTEATPKIQRVWMPSTSLGMLPAEPTRPGHLFIGWNVEADGSGEPFDANTPVGDDLTVYAQWRQAGPTLPALSVEISPATQTLSPLERSTRISVTVTGFDNNNDADSVELDINSLLPVEVQSSLEEGAKHFVLTVEYDGETTFSEGFVTLQLSLASIPEGYEYTEGTQTIQLPLMDGQSKDRPIPVDQSNLEAFNLYANAEGGRTQHYQLVENVTLPLPQGNAQNWMPIGSSTASFEGSFDGNNNTISGLRIYPPHNDYQGLFGVISSSAVIENLGLLGANIVHNFTAGGLVGKNEGGTVQNCYVIGAFDNYSIAGGVVGANEGGLVRNCHMVGNIRGPGGPVGGVVGTNNGGSVQSCYAMGSVSTNNTTAGGVVGVNNAGTVENCYAPNSVDSRSVAGGVVGDNNGTVKNSYATGSVNGSYVAGGVVGSNGGTVENCYATGTIEAEYSSVGGVSGTGGTVRNCVALNPRIKFANPSAILGRVARADAFSMNYANENMRIEVADLLVDPTSLETGLFSIHGQDIALAGTQSVTDLNWWNTPSNWLTDAGANAWDFDNVWEWRNGNLPILRNVGGEQTPIVP
ncbi:MAG: InlB B-repeat-containing protein [Cystobacterineae bacterium]|nr:InlB B-repeat-containing protein [Cystobacterineae bacterium]